MDLTASYGSRETAEIVGGSCSRRDHFAFDGAASGVGGQLVGNGCEQSELRSSHFCSCGVRGLHEGRVPRESPSPATLHPARRGVLSPVRNAPRETSTLHRGVGAGMREVVREEPYPMRRRGIVRCRPLLAAPPSPVVHQLRAAVDNARFHGKHQRSAIRQVLVCPPAPPL